MNSSNVSLYEQTLLDNACTGNQDCINTTFCCSAYSCVHPNVCLQGSKLQDDLCNYNFECMSRCCDQFKCTHFQNCYQKCNRNSDCYDTGNCCSEKQCTDSQVCNNNKVMGDYCESSSECISNYCFSNECAEELGFLPKQVIFAAIIMIACIAIGGCLCFYCFVFFKSRFGFTDSNQRGDLRSQNLMGQGENGDAMTPEEIEQYRRKHPTGLNANEFKQLVKRGNLRIPFEYRYQAAPIYEQSREDYASDSQQVMRSNYNSSQVVPGNFNSLE